MRIWTWFCPGPIVNVSLSPPPPRDCFSRGAAFLGLESGARAGARDVPLGPSSRARREGALTGPGPAPALAAQGQVFPSPPPCPRAARKGCPGPSPAHTPGARRELPHTVPAGAWAHGRGRPGDGNARPGPGRPGAAAPQDSPRAGRPRDRESARPGPPLPAAAARFPPGESEPRPARAAPASPLPCAPQRPPRPAVLPTGPFVRARPRASAPGT